MLARIMQQQTDIPPRDLEESIRRLSYETGGVGGRRENSQQQPAQVGGLGGDNGGFGLQNEQELLGLVASLEGHLTSMVNTQLDVPAQANRASRFPAPTGVPPSMMPNLATSRGPVAQSDEADWASVLLAEAGIATAAAIPAMARPAQDAAVIPPNVMDIPRNSGSLPDGVEKYPARQSAPASYSPSQLIRDDTHTAQAASLPSSHPMVPIVDPLRLRDNTRDLQPPTVVSAAEKIPAALPANEPKIESRERVVVAERTGDVGTKIGGAELGVGGPTVLVNSETEVSINNDVSIMSVDDGDASSVGVETGPPRLRTMGEVLEATNYSRCYFRHGLESVEEKLVSEGNKGDTLIGVAVPDAKYFRTLGEVKAMEVAGRCNADLLSQRRCRYPFYNIDEDLWNVAVPGPWNPPGGRAEDLTATDEGNRKRGRPGQVYVLEGAPKRPCKDKRDLCDSLLPRELPRNFVSRRPCRNTVQPPVVKSLQKGRSKRQQQPRENAPITPTDGLTAYLRARDERRAIALAWNPPHQPPLGFLRPISNTEREKERFSPPTSPHMPLPPPSQRTSRADNAFPTHMAQSKPTSIPSLSGPTPVRAPTHQPQPHQPPMPNLRGLPGPEHEGPRGHELDEITQKPRLAYPPPVTMPRDDGRGEGGFFKDPRSQGAKHFSDFEATRSPHTAPKGNPPPRADYPNDRDAGRDKPRNFKGPTPMDMDRPRMPPAVMDGVFKCAECAVAFRTPDQVEEHVRAAHSRPLPQRNDPSSAPAPRPRGSPMIGRRDSDRDLPPGWQVPPPVSTRHPSPQPPPTQRPPPPQAEMTPMQRAQHTMANVGSGSDGDVHKWRAGHRGPRKDGVPIDQKPRKPKPTLQVKPAPPPKPSSKPGPKGKRVGRKLSLSQICSFCTAEKYLPSGESEMLIHCSTCDRAGHPSCLQFESQALIDTVLSYPWQCLDCKPCSICRSIQDEDNMLCCDKCDRGYHLYCLVPKLDQPPEGDWVCPLCNGRPLPKHRNRAGDSDDDQPLIQAARPPPTTTSADNLIAPYHEG